VLQRLELMERRAREVRPARDAAVAYRHMSIAAPVRRLMARAPHRSFTEWPEARAARLRSRPSRRTARSKRSRRCSSRWSLCPAGLSPPLPVPAPPRRSHYAQLRSRPAHGGSLSPARAPRFPSQAPTPAPASRPASHLAIKKKPATAAAGPLDHSLIGAPPPPRPLRRDAPCAATPLAPRRPLRRHAPCAKPRRGGESEQPGPASAGAARAGSEQRVAQVLRPSRAAENRRSRHRTSCSPTERVTPPPPPFPVLTGQVSSLPSY